MTRIPPANVQSARLCFLPAAAERLRIAVKITELVAHQEKRGDGTLTFHEGFQAAKSLEKFFLGNESLGKYACMKNVMQN